MMVDGAMMEEKVSEEEKMKPSAAAGQTAKYCRLEQ